MLETRREITDKLSIVGHRGAAASAPENTLASFKEALRQGADIIELDVRLSADGYVVAFHDEALERTTDGHGPVAEHTLAQLKTLDAGSWFDAGFAGERIPTLEEVLAWARDRIPLFIELKYDVHVNPALDNAVISQILAYDMVDRVMVISFEHKALRRVKERLANLATGALYKTPVDDPVHLAKQVEANAVMPWWRLLAPAHVTACHAAGLSVNAWGSDADYPALVGMGVDCVNADCPGPVRRAFFQG